MHPCSYRSSDTLNCAQQVLQNAESYLQNPWPPEVYQANASYSSGLGIGSICCGLLGALCVLGMLYDEDTARQKSLVLLDQFQALYGTLLCPRLQNLTDNNCESIIQTIHRLLLPLLPEPPKSSDHTL